MHLRSKPRTGPQWASRNRGSRSSNWLQAAVTLAIAFFGCIPGSSAQTSPPQSSPGNSPAQSSQPLNPPLNLDRDPVPSPDPDPPVGAPSPDRGSTGPEAVTKGANGKYTLRQDAYEVRLNATVLDGSGRSVLDLNQDAFHVYEDGVAQTVSSFRHEDLPISLGILIDNSGSMYDKRAAVKQTSIDLFKLSNPLDESFLVDFSWDSYIDADFTSDPAKLQEGLAYLDSSDAKHGGTALYDALVVSADYLSKNAKQPKQVILIVTDGEDNASSLTREAAIRRIQDLDGPTIYCIGLLFGPDTDKNEARQARRVLESLAEQTGGVAYFPKSLKEVDPIAAEVAREIRTQYTIAYRSTKPPALGGYRQVHVEAKEKGYGKLQVRTRTGYFPKTDTPASASGSSE